MDNSMRSIIADRQARAASARKLAGQLADEEARRGVLRYADELEREAAKLRGLVVGNTPAKFAIDVI